MKIGIRFKLVFFISVLLLFVIALLSFLVLNGIKIYQNKEAEGILLNQKDMFEQYLDENFSLNNANTNEKFELVRATIFNKPWLRTIPANIYDTKGNLLSGFKPEGKLNENPQKNIMIKNALQDKISYKYDKNIIYFYSPIKYKNNTAAILELQYSTEESNKFYNNIKFLFYYTGSLSLIIGIILGYLYLSNFTKAIYIMKNSIKNIQTKNFYAVKELVRKDELGELSKGLIYMSNTIEKSIKDLETEKDTLSKAVKKLKQMDRQQKDFIGNVSHEFKTPITSIKAYADVMNMYSNDLTLISNGTESISKECDRLTNMVDKILKLSSLDKYDFEIEKNIINIKDLIEQICSRMSGKVKKNKLALNYHVDNLNILSDSESLRHIIINLIDNAVKYNTPGGNINIVCHQQDKLLKIDVEDTGIGMSQEHLSKIFEPFYRAAIHRSSKVGGAGLGLALVENMVKKLQGTISVNSTLGKGTTFSIKLPIYDYHNNLSEPNCLQNTNK
ncbi:sensor histidine kinase ResE [Clostridium pasteurianum DSM 525 = ATCC 6013]|uniref:histidine kinase n=1 Tax=Clostridium pasteurianum DSM 525 = ATCC 6013 TaxID=1262449 RepID=A0A0H3J6D7_CLOPA|nr:HAMP domain-containing sensor histidine kinase [Clostridium pasteurianum]AJA49019.1 sensor histidine kinase ResE [Clostridium pasteurianum DSM 525 = ATCC 6013]AJA53007.1 sensor histidine kinase ResE [Clostridium pasteurianum DSM 525 = ATCC 6013]AOZ76225.1 histidine kinase [Clostridium pasteurianum DSM 525 = ATCC 6013]AOZ80021.1 histidine kinase [Clostridium pasteurianum]ELP60315.1 signal transduction histidine kinase [Clostridium pasteurianum DSM 525 = ATCC 6013]